MKRDRRKEIKCHLFVEKIDEMLRDAEDDARLRRIGFIKNLYQGDTVPEAAEREGRSPATGNRWADAWNEGGFDELMPSFGGGRPPKLDANDRRELLERLREDQPWNAGEIQQLLDEAFDVEYHPDYLGTVLRDIGLSYAKPRSKRPEDSEKTSDDSADNEGGWVVDEDICTDGE
jgi:transposase